MTTAVKTPFADASPTEIREAILPEDRAEFERQYHEALNVAARTYNLGALEKMSTSWRLTARQLTAIGPEAWRKILAKAQHTLRTGERPADMVPMEEMDRRLVTRLTGA